MRVALNRTTRGPRRTLGQDEKYRPAFKSLKAVARTAAESGARSAAATPVAATPSPVALASPARAVTSVKRPFPSFS